MFHISTGRHYRLPARPTWMISPVLCPSLLNDGHPALSAFARLISSFVPMILKVDLSGSMGPYRGSWVLYRLLSAVGRSRSTVSGDENSTFARSRSIFLR